MEALAREALERLGVRRFVLSIHQASFPAGEDDVGAGTPYSARGLDLVEYAAGIGFDGVALGPGGKTSRSNPSPYDASAFSRSPLHIALGPLTGASDEPWAKTLDPAEIRAARPAGPVSYTDAFDAHAVLRATAFTRAEARASAEIEARLGAFRAPWLARERRFEVLTAALGTDDWRGWPASAAEGGAHEAVGRRFELEQLLVHEQHERFRVALRQRGIRLYADLAIGTSHRDRWALGHLFLPTYLLGAPPSRTNPLGQPWGYPVLDPSGGGAGAVRAFVQARMAKLFAEHDGVRIDHPHGWVCPWVYDAASADPAEAVRRGARLFESPDLPDHPALARYARVEPEQIDRTRPRHADDWTRDLRSEQIERYAVWFDLFVELARRSGGGAEDLMVEVLSTCPRPLSAVLERHGLGRFRVTQKADPDSADDVYRSDRARPEDWIMMGNHDTPPAAVVIERWRERGTLDRHIQYLAGRLTPQAGSRARFAERLEREPGALVTALLADLFLGPARQVLVFWADLFGERRLYNRPGEVHTENWTLRVAPDFERQRSLAVARGDAPRVERALVWALEAKGIGADGLAEKLAGPAGP